MGRYLYDDMLERMLERMREAHENGPEVIVLKNKLVTARKQHKCHDCNGDILVGTQHRYWVARVDRLLCAERRHEGDCYLGPDISGY